MKTVLWTTITLLLLHVGNAENINSKKQEADIKKDKRGALKPILNLVSPAPTLEANILGNVALPSKQGLNTISVPPSRTINFNLLPNPTTTSISHGETNLDLLQQSDITTSGTNQLNILPNPTSTAITNGGLNYVDGGVQLTNTLVSNTLSNTGLLNNVALTGILPEPLRFNFAIPQQQTLHIQSSPVQLDKQSIRTVVQQVPVSVPQPYPVTITKQVPVPQPYAVHITRHVPVPIHIKVPYEVPKPYEVRVPYPVPVPVQVKVPVEVPKPYRVEITKTVPVPVEKQVIVRVPHPVHVPVPQPYPVPVPQPVQIKVPHPVIIREPQIVKVPAESGSVQINSGSVLNNVLVPGDSVQPNSGILVGSEVAVVNSGVNNLINNSNGLPNLESVKATGVFSSLSQPVSLGQNFVTNAEGCDNCGGTLSYREAQLASLLPPPAPIPASTNLEHSYVSSIQGGMYGLNKFQTADYQKTW